MRSHTSQIRASRVDSLATRPALALAYNVLFSFAWGHWAWMKLVTSVSVTVFSLSMLVIPVVGLLYLDNYRQSLIESELELLKTEAQIFSGALAASGVVTGPLGEERLLPETTRQTVRRLVDVSQTRARLFSPDGSLIADSFLLSGPGGVVEMQPLAPLDADDSFLWRTIVGAYDWIAGLLPNGGPLPPYSESSVQSAQDYAEVQKALAGETATAVRDAGGGRMVLSVAVPVQRYRQVLGSLFLTKPGDSIEATLRDTRLTVLGVFAVALSVTVLLSLYLASTIAWPIHRLADAAERVRRAKGRQVKIPDLSRRKDEIGDLSGALRDMTQAVWKRMDAIERFAADVSHEIKNPLTSLRSAVETVARIDDPAAFLAPLVRASTANRSCASSRSSPRMAGRRPTCHVTWRRGWTTTSSYISISCWPHSAASST